MRISDWSSDVCSSDLRVLDDKGEVPALAHAFAEAQRRHVAWESAVLYPLARARLHPALLRDLSRRLERRRRQGRSRLRRRGGPEAASHPERPKTATAVTGAILKEEALLLDYRMGH